MSLRRILLAIGLAWLCGARAQASPFDLYGSGAGPLAMAGGLVTHHGDVHSAYYNPAGLARLAHFEILAASVIALPALSLELDGRPFSPDFLTVDRSKSPPTVKLAPDGASDVDFTAQEAEMSSGAVIGVGGPLGPKSSFLGRFAFGLLFYQPFAQIIRERFGRGEDPYFLDYEDRGMRLMIIVAAAGEILRDRLSVGLALNILADSDATLETVPTPSTRIDLVGRLAFNAGVLWSPHRRVRLGFCFRDKLALTAQTEILPLTAQQGLELEILNPISRDNSITVKTLFSPRAYVLGAGVDWTERLTTLVELGLVDWSSYEPPFAPPMEVHQVGAAQNQCVAVNNECIRNQPKEVAAIRSTMELDLKPVFVPRAALSWNIWRGLVLRGGYAFLPTPVPSQTGVTNILDSHKHLLGLGGGYAHGFGKSTLRAEVGLQLHLLQPRRFTKDLQDPAIGLYSKAASGVDRDARYAPNPLAPEYPRAAPEVELGGHAVAVALSLAYDYTL